MGRSAIHLTSIREKFLKLEARFVSSRFFVV
jgi:hypothetical protein